MGENSFSLKQEEARQSKFVGDEIFFARSNGLEIIVESDLSSSAL
jgi:hypothetical protein